MSELLWGAATSAHQIEGENDRNDWWAWEQQGHIEGGVRSGAATDHRRRFREDLALAKDLGLDSYRFSVEWSRIEPEEGKWNREAIEWYSELLVECERLKLLPMLTLHHFTLPQWVAEEGGFANERTVKRFTAFVKKVAETLGPRVPLWCTINEPMVLVGGAYIGKFMPPARFAPHLASAAARNLLESHVRAYDVLHSQIPGRIGTWKDRPLEVGIVHNLLDFLPDRTWHPIERYLASRFHRFYNQAFLDAVTGKPERFGVFPVIPRQPVLQEAVGRRTTDFIGVNYYTKCYVKWRPKDVGEGHSADVPIGMSFARRGERVSDLDWAVHPAGFGKMLRFAARYGLPLYVTENGIADREDRLRPAFLRDHIRELLEARASGIDIRGYYHWSLLDNFEWIKGFGPRFGLFAVDYETYERTPRPSAQIYKALIAQQRQNAKAHQSRTS